MGILWTQNSGIAVWLILERRMPESREIKRKDIRSCEQVFSEKEFEREICISVNSLQTGETQSWV